MKITLITGAASGLGKEFAKLYVKDNNNVLLVDIDDEGLVEASEELKALNPNVVIDTYVADLSQKEDLNRVFEYTKYKEYFVNNLVNSAGFGDRCDFKDMDVNKQMKMTDVCCNALLYFSRVYLDDMLKNNEGHIINVSSIAGFMPGPYMCTYHACKSYVLLLGEAISYEVRKTNVKCLTLCPGPFLSKFVTIAHNDYTFSKIKPYEAKDVAAFGYNKSLKGKSLAITGFKNKLTVFACRFFPRAMVSAVSASTMKKDA